MSYQTRSYDNEHGDPVVVLVATGTHDVSRLVNLLTGATPNTEQLGLGHQIKRQVRRHNAGRAALALLRRHGGPDFTEDPSDPGAVELAERRAAADLHSLARAAERVQGERPTGCACPSEHRKACGWREGIGRVVDVIRERAGKTKAPQPDDEDLRALRLAINDPGAFGRRKLRPEPERLVEWQARAVRAAGWAPTAKADVR